MNTDIPDHYAGNRAPFRVVEPSDHSTLEEAVGRMMSDPPPAPREPTDIEYVANSIDRCRYLDLKNICKAIMGDKQVTTPAELADLSAEWAAANKSKVQA